MNGVTGPEALERTELILRLRGERRIGLEDIHEIKQRALQVTVREVLAPKSEVRCDWL